MFKYIRDIRNIRSSDQIRSNTEIQSSNMFRSRILNIRKVQIRSNIKCFEFFGQPSSEYLDVLTPISLPTGFSPVLSNSLLQFSEIA